MIELRILRRDGKPDELQERYRSPVNGNWSELQPVPIVEEKDE